MAGGSGTRLWPASSSRLPKQFLPIAGEKGGRCFFNAAVDRALALTRPAGRILILAGKAHTAHILDACARYSPEERGRMLLIPEPEAKNTAPALACAARYAALSDKGADSSLLVLTSDHIIQPLEGFLDGAKTAEAAVRHRAREDGGPGKGQSAGLGLAVFGITPQRPETGFGYIEAGEKIPATVDGAARGARLYAAKSFREKPDRGRAEAFIKAGNFFWNSGMFAFSTRFIIEEFKQNAPLVYGPFEKLSAPDEKAFTNEGGLSVLAAWRGLDAAYRETEALSFDYAIAEKCRQTVMIKAAFDWIDVGSWDEYAALSGKTAGVADGIVFTENTEVFQTGAKNCFVDSGLPVALIGVEDLIVSVRPGKDGRPGAVLISKRGESQKVRDIVEQIKKAGRKELL